MADASCSGPSPFKRLVDQQTRDVSHHQDRLVNGSPANAHHNGFRSQPVHPSQSQNDFGAFMNGAGPIPGAPHHAAGRLAAHAAALEPLHPQMAHAPMQHQSRISPAPEASNWAADFARFAGPSPAQQQPQSHAPPHLQQQQNTMAQAFGFQPNMASMQPNAGFSPFYGGMSGTPMGMNAAPAQRHAADADFDQEMSRWMAVHGDGAQNAKAMEDVDAVMDQMARELELNDHVLDDKTTQVGSTEQEAVVQTQESHFTDLGSTELGNLSRNEAESLAQQQQEDLDVMEQEQEVANDPSKVRSEVSEAAERLLESVQHEDGDKWKNSVFLSLMRDFRDGRKDIVDNEIRETPEDNAASGQDAIH